MTKIAVIVGSTRPGRQTDRLAKWAANELSKHADTEIVDLQDYPLSFLNEPMSPRYNPDRQLIPEVKKWLDKVAEFDGYAIVTPEYNRSTSAVLKNAIDYLGYEADNKPAALIGHGSTGGAQAVANLRMALPGVGVVTIPQALFFGDHLSESINDAGELDETRRAKPHGPQSQLEAQAKSLVWYADALKAAR